MTLTPQNLILLVDFSHAAEVRIVNICFYTIQTVLTGDSWKTSPLKNISTCVSDVPEQILFFPKAFPSIASAANEGRLAPKTFRFRHQADPKAVPPNPPGIFLLKTLEGFGGNSHRVPYD